MSPKFRIVSGPSHGAYQVAADTVLLCRAQIAASLIGKKYHENKDTEYVLMPGDDKLEELVDTAMRQIGLVPE